MPETQGDPRLVDCPACYSKAGQACTAPTNDGQRKVNWYHISREDAARVTTTK